MLKKLIVLYLMLLLTTWSQAQIGIDNNGSLLFGMYMRDSSKTFNRVTPSVVSDSKISTTIPFIEKAGVSLYIDNPYSEVFSKSEQPEFFFYFVDKQNKKALTSADFEIMTKNYPFVYGCNPNQFVLIRLFKTKENRALRLEKENVFSGTKFKPLSIDTIPYVSIPISGSSFKIVPEKLPPGEYGFIYKEPVPYGRIVYDFSIE